jgi:hypothetical protein
MSAMNASQADLANDHGMLPPWRWRINIILRRHEDFNVL